MTDVPDRALSITTHSADEHPRRAFAAGRHDQHALISAVDWVITLRSERDHWVALDIDDRFLGRYWSPWVCHPTEAGVYNRHALESAVLFEVMAGLRAGDLYVEGAAHFGNYHAELFDGQVDEHAVTMALVPMPTPHSGRHRDSTAVLLTGT